MYDSLAVSCKAPVFHDEAMVGGHPMRREGMSVDTARSHTFETGLYPSIFWFDELKTVGGER